MKRWQGRLPLSSRALAAVLDRATNGGGQFSQAERALFTACEFWAAVEGRTLLAYLGAEPTEPLCYLSIVLAAMGTPNVARALVEAVGALREAGTASARAACLNALQMRLLQTADRVDLGVARMAIALRLDSGRESIAADRAGMPATTARAGHDDRKLGLFLA